MKNAAFREVPDVIPGIGEVKHFKGAFAYPPTGNLIGKSLRMGIPGVGKVRANLEEAIEAAGLKDGMRISFHHHFRNGEGVIKQVLEIANQKGIKDLALVPSSLSDCHDFLIDYIEAGVVTEIETSGMRGKLGAFLTKNPGKLKKPLIIRSHGGRARAIECGDSRIDIAFLGVPAADRFGNANGIDGPTPCGALGYAMVDAQYAEQVVLLTNHLVEGSLFPFSIPQHQVDHVVAVESIGDPEGIGFGSLRMTRDPIQLLLAKTASDVFVRSPYFKEGFSVQMGGGGASMAVQKFVKEEMMKREMKASFGIGGATIMFLSMMKEGFFEAFYDTQSFDIQSAQFMKENQNHIEISASQYANPHHTGPIVNYLDVVFLAATEVDVNFNVNVITNSNGLLMGASGGHCDTAAGAKMTIIVVPLIRGRLPMIRDHVQNVVTPGESIDVVVTDYGIAINPRRKDLIDHYKGSGLNIKTIEELQAIAYKKVGKPEAVPLTDDIIGVIEYRDGSIIDAIYAPGKSKF
jgi:citrate lyase, alpha subunit